MLKRLVTALTIAAMVASSAVMVSAASIPSSGTTTIYPNKLTITWANGQYAPVTINTFRFYDYNVAQLRTMVNALGGSVNLLQDGTYQISTTGGGPNYSDIGFTSQQDIKYIMNTTQIRDINGTLLNPNQPGWVFLPDYNYNWASIRDIIQAMGLNLVSVNDNPAAGTTSVVVSPGTTTIDNTTGLPPGWLSVLTPGSGSYGYITPYVPTPVPVYYTVTFDLNGAPGVPPIPQTVLAGQPVSQPSDPVWDQHQFLGWNTMRDGSGQWVFVNDYTIPTLSCTIYAIWGPVTATYTVTFKDYDGTVLNTQDVPVGEAATPPADPTRTGYTFTGWDVAFGNIIAPLTVTAQYEINTYTVTFKDWDGSTIKTQTVDYGRGATAPADPTRVDYTFTGWDVVFNNVTADLTVKAQYEATQPTNPTGPFKVTFKLIDTSGSALTVSGSSLDTTQTVPANTVITVPEGPKVDGYTFLGWYTSLDESAGRISGTYKVTANTTLLGIYLLNGSQEPVTPPDENVTVESVEIVSVNPYCWTGDQPNVEVKVTFSDGTSATLYTGDSHLEITAEPFNSSLVDYTQENCRIIATYLDDEGVMTSSPPEVQSITTVSYDNLMLSLDSLKSLDGLLPGLGTDYEDAMATIVELAKLDQAQLYDRLDDAFSALDVVYKTLNS